MTAKLIIVAIMTALLTSVLLTIVFTRSASAADAFEVRILGCS